MKKPGKTRGDSSVQALPEVSPENEKQALFFVCFWEEAVISALGAPLEALENSWGKPAGEQKRNNMSLGEFVPKSSVFIASF